MPKKTKASKKTAQASLPSKESDTDKSPSISSPPSKLSNKKFLKSPSCDEKPKPTRSKTKKSSARKGKEKSKNMEDFVEESSHVNENKTKEDSSEIMLCKNATPISGSTTLTTQKHEQKRKDHKTTSSIHGEAVDLQSSPCPERVESRPGSPASVNDRNMPSTSSQKEKVETSGRSTMVQTNLTVTKDGIEVLSSPEQKETQKKKGKKTSSKKKEKSEKTQTRITNIFPLRKSNRKTKSQQEKDEQARITKAIISKRFEGLEVRAIEGKGRGVFATRHFQRSDFVCEYSGELIGPNEAKKREKKYSEDSSIGCYMYYLQCNNNKYCIDATAEDGTLGRLLNHSRSGNCKTKVHVIKDKPHLIFVTTREVKTGEELTYDYGDRSKDSLQSHPWLKS